MTQSFLGVSDMVWGVACGVIAIVFARIWPIRPRADSYAQLTARWLHPLVWTLLAFSFLVRSLGSPAGGAANVFALLAALAYVGFVAILVAAGQGGSREGARR